MELNNSSLPEMYSKGLLEEFNKNLSPHWTGNVFETLFTGAAKLLGAAKTQDRPVAFVVQKLNKEFAIAAIIQYFEGKDKDKVGNWSLVWTFNESDIPENAERILLTDPRSHTYFISYAGEKFGIRFKSDENLITTLTYVPVCIKKWLDENAKEKEEVTLELKDVFVARVAVENGEKVFAIEATGESTFVAKGDTSIEK